MSSHPLYDQRDRQRIRSSLDESFLVEAAAGTGKTTELVARLVSVLREGKATVGEIVAVTFTRKAAGELKLRLRQELDRARGEVSDPGARRNLEAAIAQLEEARIGTIHSFCSEILRERPVEAGVDPAFEELAEEEAPRLYRRAFNAWVQEKLDEMPEGLRRALSRLALSRSYIDPGSPLDRLREASWRLAEWRDFPTAWRQDPFSRTALVDALVDQVLDLAEQSSRCPNSKDYLRLALEPAELLATWIERAEAVAERDYDVLEARLIDLQRALARDSRKGWGKFAPGLSRDEVLAGRERLLAQLKEFKHLADADLAALLHRELGEVIQRYEDTKRRSGRVDFVDLLIRTRDLVRDQPQVRRHLQERFSHLFVDEFQDTDPLQAEILLLLAADDPKESDWRRVNPLPGKLFLVGDPKQSIYRFRRADVLLYQEVKGLLTRRGVRQLHLTQSYRATRPLQAAINNAFAPEMTGDPESGQPDYLPLGPVRQAQAGQPSLIALPAPEPYSWQRITKYQVENCLPDTVGAFVTWLLNDSGWTVEDPQEPGRLIPLLPRHVCLLFRRFTSWGRDITRDYLRALEARGVPHVLVGARSFHQREEVETLRSALTAVEWPDDELAVFATLRGSLFSLPDHVLLRFREEVGRLHPFLPDPGPRYEEDGEEEEDRAASEEDEEVFDPVWEALEFLARLHRQRNYRAIVETLQELLEFTRAHAGFALRPAGNQVLANVERVCDLARSYELRGGISFRGFVEHLDAEAERPRSIQAPVVEEGAEGVRVMTVHNAKGLEFPVVLLADITARLAAWEPDRYIDADARLCATRILGCAPVELLENADSERRRDEAEGVRVAYVAATRARDLLVVPAVGDEPMEGWVQPLNKAIYPQAEGWRRAQPAPGCPPLGDRSVLKRPQEYDGRVESSVRPGLHPFGEYDVVWWDPAILVRNVEANFGLRQEEILSEDEGGRTAEESLERYESWRERREGILESGARPEMEVLAVTDTQDPPQRYVAQIEVLVMEKPPHRPSGPRFGTLVHTLMRDVAFDAQVGAVRDLAELHGRLADATEEEVEAACEAAVKCLKHPLLVRARSAAQEGRCYREAPFLLPLGGLKEGKIVEGTLDLAFFEDGGWVVVDFKTDVDLTARRSHYHRQLAWYLFAMEKITDEKARGYLLGI